jgi:hypothetical protein
MTTQKTQRRHQGRSYEETIEVILAHRRAGCPVPEALILELLDHADVYPAYRTLEEELAAVYRLCLPPAKAAQVIAWVRERYARTTQHLRRYFEEKFHEGDTEGGKA